MTDDIKTFTQDEVNKIVEQRLMRERDKFKDYDALKKAAEEAEQTSQSFADEKAKLLEQVKSYQNKLEAIEKENILDELGLPRELSDRVTGSTTDEFRKDAEGLKAVLGLQSKVIGNGTNPANSNAVAKTFTKTELARMSPDEINANWDAVKNQLSNGIIR